MSVNPKIANLRIAALILAAGDSQRMQQPKALLRLGDRTFLETILQKYLSLNCHPLIVILGCQASQIQTVLGSFPCLTLTNPAPENGPRSSVLIGLQALPNDCPGFFIHPVDHPLITVSTLEELIHAWDGSAERVVKPTFGGRGGHPLLLGRRWRSLLQQAPPNSTLRDLLSQHPHLVVRLAVSDPGILANINTTRDYDQIRHSD